MATLQILSGPLAGREHQFSTPLVVGRAEADLDIMDPEISRQHLKLTPLAAGVEIVDLNSSNGTWIAGRRLTAPAILTQATTLRAGQTTFELVPGTPSS